MDELTEMLLAARAGDRPALASFVRRSQADVWRFVAHRVGTIRSRVARARADLLEQLRAAAPS